MVPINRVLTCILKYFFCAVVVLAPMSCVLHLLMDSYFTSNTTTSAASNELWISYPDDTMLVSIAICTNVPAAHDASTELHYNEVSCVIQFSILN